MAAVSQSACIDPSAGILMGFGSPIGSAFDSTALAAVGPTSIVLTPNVPISKGKLRLQCLNPNAATTIAIGAITAVCAAPGGNVTVQIGGTANVSATAAGALLDFLKDFILPYPAISFSIPVTLGGGTTTGTFNSEVNGNP